LVPEAALHVSDWDTVDATKFHASNFSKAPIVSPAVHPAGCVQAGVPPCPMKPKRTSAGFDVVMEQDAGELAFTMTGVGRLGSKGDAVFAPPMVMYITSTADKPSP